MQVFEVDDDRSVAHALDDVHAEIPGHPAEEGECVLERCLAADLGALACKVDDAGVVGVAGGEGFDIMCVVGVDLGLDDFGGAGGRAGVSACRHGRQRGQGQQGGDESCESQSHGFSGEVGSVRAAACGFGSSASHFNTACDSSMRRSE
jgi:hypothetical protein